MMAKLEAVVMGDGSMVRGVLLKDIPEDKKPRTRPDNKLRAKLVTPFNGNEGGLRAVRAHHTAGAKHLAQYLELGMNLCEESPSCHHVWVGDAPGKIWVCKYCHNVRVAKDGPLAVDLPGEEGEGSDEPDTGPEPSHLT